MKYLVGIDEAGRGPLAGPVAIGVVFINPDFNWELIPGVGDSKKVSPKKREAIFERAMELKKGKLLDFHVSLVGAKIIDKKGIVPAIKQGMRNCLTQLEKRQGFQPADLHIKLDGALSAPPEFIYQETIIKGDSKELTIGLASILAKVTRDNYMVEQTKIYPEYEFDIHKGYGTKKHRELIKQHGLSPIHRVSFCRSSYFGTNVV